MRGGVPLRQRDRVTVPFDSDHALEFGGEAFRKKSRAAVGVDQQFAAGAEYLADVRGKGFGNAVVGLLEDTSSRVRAECVVTVARLWRAKFLQRGVDLR